MDNPIDDVAALESCLGKTPGGAQMKTIDHLDAEARRWLGHSPFAFVAHGSVDQLDITLAGGERGFAKALDETHLQLPLAALDAPVARGASIGTLFLIPGIGETLRVNGRVTDMTDDALVITIDECFLHCAKALLRSEFWQAQSVVAPESTEAFCKVSRLMAVATISADGRADLSPKGDPAGLLLQWHNGALWYPERPGNHRYDSFRNLLANPRVAIAALVPGASMVLSIDGTTRLGSDPAMRDYFAVEGRAPKVVTCVEAVQVLQQQSAALMRARLWPSATAPADIDAAAIFAAHVKRNKSRGLVAGIVRTAVSVPGLMAAGLRSDYKNNMY